MIPFACGMGLCLSNCPTHKGGVYLFPNKTKTKRTMKIKNPKNNIEKDKKKGKKENQQEKIEIHKNFKNYTIKRNK